MRNEKPKIIIIEDHPVMREGLAAWFAKTGRWQVEGTASTLAEAKELLTAINADIILLDIQLEDGWDLDIIPWLEKQTGPSEKVQPVQHPGPVMAVYSVFDDYAHVSAALGLGVRAYVCKRRTEQELEEALQTALSGGLCIDDSARKRLLNVTDLISLLTKREAEILTLVKSGLPNKEIAARLGLSRRTVENILSCVYDKTGIRSRRELERL